MGDVLNVRLIWCQVNFVLVVRLVDIYPKLETLVTVNAG